MKYKELSFTWMTPALQTGNKTVTRRNWHSHEQNIYKKDDIVVAMDKKRNEGGNDIALIKIMESRLEYPQNVPESDYVAEGFEYLDLHPEMLQERNSDFALWQTWEQYRKSYSPMFLLRFTVLHVFYCEWLERAAIFEFESGMKRTEAEALAYTITHVIERK